MFGKNKLNRGTKRGRTGGPDANAAPLLPPYEKRFGAASC